MGGDSTAIGLAADVVKGLSGAGAGAGAGAVGGEVVVVGQGKDRKVFIYGTRVCGKPSAGGQGST